MWLLSLLLLGGCGHEPPSPRDGGEDTTLDAPPPAPDAAVSEPRTPTAPAPPAPPVLLPCPEGWHERSEEGAAPSCEPFPATPAACPAGQLRWPGGSCGPIGATCPGAGEFPEISAGAMPIYVDAAAPSAGDGTRAAPLVELADALAAASNGTIIALAEGRYEGPFAIPDGVTLRGACAARTILTAATGGAVVTATGSVGLSDLAIADAAVPGVTVTGGALVLRSVEISHVTLSALSAFDGGAIDASALWIHDTQPDARGDFGRGITVDASAATLTRIVVEDNHEQGIVVLGGTIDLQDALIARTESQSRDRRFGLGLVLTAGATGLVERVVIEGNRMIGLSVSGAESSLQATDLLIRGTRSQEVDGHFGRGIDVAAGGSFVGERVLVEQNQEAGIIVTGTMAVARLSDVVIRDQRGRESDASLGYALLTRSGGRAELTRADLAGNRDLAVHVVDPDTRVSLHDVVVRGTQPDEIGEAGRGVNVQDDAELDFIRGAILESFEIGASVASGAALRLEDVVIESTRSRRSDGLFGRALNVQEDATLVAARVALLDNRELGLVALGGCDVELDDVSIADTMGRASDGMGGVGAMFHDGCSVRGSRVQISRSLSIGLFVGESTDAAFEDARVVTVEAVPCLDDACESRFGIAAGSYFSGSELALTRFVLDRAALCGVHVAQGGHVTLRDGVVSNNGIGACVEAADFDLSDLTDRVQFIENAQRLETETLPVPDIGLFTGSADG